MNFLEFLSYKKKVLFIVDVQEAFMEFMNPEFVESIMKYSREFDEVYQIWDNHFKGKPTKEYLLGESKCDTKLYDFPNQTQCLEKRYTYDVDISHFKDFIEPELFLEIKEHEKGGKIKPGMKYPTNISTYLIYVGNNHTWFHIPKKMCEVFESFRLKEVVLIGGSYQECFLDVMVAMKSFGIDVKIDKRYMYSAKKCPLK